VQLAERLIPDAVTPCIYGAVMTDDDSPKIYFELPGVEHFEPAIALVRATGARGIRARTFVIDGPMTIPQVVALLRLDGYSGWDGGQGAFGFSVEPDVPWPSGQDGYDAHGWYSRGAKAGD